MVLSVCVGVVEKDMTAISKDQWLIAQTAEKEMHTMSYEEGSKHYKHSYDCYFKYLGIGYNHSTKTIIEIGCADFPALEHCKVLKGICVEPMPSSILKEIAKRKKLEIIQAPVEEIDLPKCDEIWLLNVMQHIIDPDLFVSRCKDAAKIIRYFEPIDYPTCIYHPHTFTLNQFKNWFNDAKRYNDKVPGFHEAECAYGTWIK